jgi:hypothetical protein
LIVLVLRALEKLTVFFFGFENRFSFVFVEEEMSKEGKRFSETLKEFFRPIVYSRLGFIRTLKYSLLVIH